MLAISTCASILTVCLLSKWPLLECRNPAESSGGFRGGKALAVAYITARVHQMIMQQWHAATATRHSYTYQFLTDLQTFD